MTLYELSFSQYLDSHSNQSRISNFTEVLDPFDIFRPSYPHAWPVCCFSDNSSRLSISTLLLEPTEGPDCQTEKPRASLKFMCQFKPVCMTVVCLYSTYCTCLTNMTRVGLNLINIRRENISGNTLK